jgi:hypothetical protein
MLVECLVEHFHLKVWQKQAMKQWSKFVDFNAPKLFEVFQRAFKIFHSSFKTLFPFESQIHSENSDNHHKHLKVSFFKFQLLYFRKIDETF